MKINIEDRALAIISNINILIKCGIIPEGIYPVAINRNHILIEISNIDKALDYFDLSYNGIGVPNDRGRDLINSLKHIAMSCGGNKYFTYAVCTQESFDNDLKELVKG